MVTEGRKGKVGWEREITINMTPPKCRKDLTHMQLKEVVNISMILFNVALYISNNSSKAVFCPHMYAVKYLTLPEE